MEWRCSFRREILLVVAVVALAYFPSQWNGFVLDDARFVLLNPLVTGNLDLWRIATETYPPGARDQGLYRPLIVLSYHLDAWLWNFAAPGGWNGFHLTNLIIHAVNAVLLLALLRRLGLTQACRLVAVVIFGIHPALSEAVGWIAGRAELLGLTFGLAAMLVFLRQPRGVGLIVTCSLWILAMLCKEHWVVFPVLLGWLLICLPALPVFDRRAIIRLIILSAGLLGAFWLARYLIIGSWRPSLAAYETVVATPSRIATVLALLWEYIGLWFWPVALSVHHEVQPVVKAGQGIALLASWLFAFWLSWRARRFFPWITLAVGWFWIALLPVSNLIVPVGVVFGERFLYLSTLFFAPTLVLGARKVLGLACRGRDPRLLAVVVALVCCPALLSGLWLRLGDWRSNVTLWRSAEALYPRAFAVKATLADALLNEAFLVARHGSQADAARKFAAAHSLAREALLQLAGKPGLYQDLFVPHLREIDTLAQSGVRRMIWAKKIAGANAIAREGRTQEALAAYRKLVEEFPEIAETRVTMGELYVLLKNPVAARQQFAWAIDQGLKNPILFARYAQVLSELGSKAEAVLMYERSLQGDPANAQTHYNHGVVLAELGDYPGALDSFRAANRQQPGFVAARLNAAGILIHLKRYDEAKAELERVLALNVQTTEARQLLQKIPGAANDPRGGRKPPEGFNDAKP